ncbi:hypothetical protein ACWE42_23080 [Sutcliffiella cohnii]
MYPYRQFPVLPPSTPPPFGAGGGMGPGSGFGPPGQGFGPPGQAGMGQQFGPPSSPPPATPPTTSFAAGPSVMAADPGALRGCLFRFTWIRLNSGQSFWLYPTYIGRRSVAGWRWTGFRWVYFGIDIRRIQSFQCV